MKTEYDGFKFLKPSPNLSRPTATLSSKGEERGWGRGAKKLKQAKLLRKNQTLPERRLWQYLRAKRFNDLKFRRQHPIGPYIVDFYCANKNLIVELDGSGHNIEKQMEYDKRRDNYLKRKGYTVLRIWNNELTENISGVMETIAELCGLV